MKKIRDSKWAIALVPSFVGAVLTLVVDGVKDIDIFSTLKLVLVTVCRWIMRFLNFEIKLLWILVVFGILLAILWVIIKIVESKKLSPPERMSYTEDHFTDWRWSWKWEKDYRGEYQIGDLVAHCPKCNTPMRHDDYDTTFHCPRCKYDSRYHSDNHHDVTLVIYDNINRKIQHTT